MRICAVNSTCFSSKIQAGHLIFTVNYFQQYAMLKKGFQIKHFKGNTTEMKHRLTLTHIPHDKCQITVWGRINRFTLITNSTHGIIKPLQEEDQNIWKTVQFFFSLSLLEPYLAKTELM